jgi:hypothetical protein
LSRRLLGKAADVPVRSEWTGGPVTLTVPATLSETSYADLSDEFELILRRAKRRVKPNDEAAN